MENHQLRSLQGQQQVTGRRRQSQATVTTSGNLIGHGAQHLETGNRDPTAPWSQSPQNMKTDEFFGRPYILSKFFMSLCCNSSLLVVICILLWGNESINHGIIIYNETNEWSKGGIIDITYLNSEQGSILNGDNANTPSCPEGYQMVQGTYFGTNKICLDVDSQQYNIGQCEHETDQNLQEIDDIEEQTISRLNGTYICYRTSTHDYHDMMRNRDKYNTTRDDNLTSSATDSTTKTLVSTNASSSSNKDNNRTLKSADTSVASKADLAGQFHTTMAKSFGTPSSYAVKLAESNTTSEGNVLNNSTLGTQSKYTCGSQRDSNKKYAPMEADGSCFLNDLYFQLTGNQSNVQNISLKNAQTLNKHYLMIERTDNEQNNPMVKLYYGISQPCINVNTQFMNRSKPIPLIYRNENNNCDSYGTSLHYQYLKTGFEQSELLVYTDNNLTDTLRQEVPHFSEEDLTLNQYRLYYKPYALWTLKCQQKITTEDIAQFAAQIMQNEENQRLILKTTSYFIGFEYIFTIIVMILNKQVKNKHMKAFNVLVGLGLLCTVGLLLGLFLMYTDLFRHFFIDGVEILSFANKELCSEGVLAQAMLQYEHKSTQDQTIIKIGFILSGSILMLNLLNFFACTNLKAQIHANCTQPKADILGKTSENGKQNESRKLEISEERTIIGETLKDITRSEEPNPISIITQEERAPMQTFQNLFNPENQDILESSPSQKQDNSHVSNEFQFAGTFQQEKVQRSYHSDTNSRYSQYLIPPTSGSPSFPGTSSRQLLVLDTTKFKYLMPQTQEVNIQEGRAPAAKEIKTNSSFQRGPQATFSQAPPSVPAQGPSQAANDAKSELENIYINFYSQQHPSHTQAQSLAPQNTRLSAQLRGKRRD